MRARLWRQPQIAQGDELQPGLRRSAPSAPGCRSETAHGPGQVTPSAKGRGLIARGGRSCDASGLLDLDFLLLRHLRRLWQVDVQYAPIKFRLYLRRVGVERQRDRSAERAIAAFHHVPVLVLVLLVTLGPFLTADVSIPLASVTSTSFSSTPGNSAVTSIASLLSATSIFGMSEPNRANGLRCEKSSNVFWTSTE
jgi:hypothetical protein